MSFPTNPASGATIELNGARYQYDGKTKSWNRIEGVVRAASVYSSGLMTKEEYNKLSRLILPPPNTTLRGESCNTPYVGGTVNLKSTDDFLSIRNDVDVHTPDAIQSYEFRIHENTVGFNFDVDVQGLVQYLVDKGQLRFIAKTGGKGLTGPKGPVGDDSLEIGPQGLPGEDGVALYDLNISADPLSYQNLCGNQRRAITKIVPDGDTGRLLVHRSIVGNPNAAPHKVKAGQGSSTWVVVLPTSATTTASAIYYLDFQLIIDAFNEKYQSELQRIKAGYEDVVNFWLTKMSTLFDQQKTALCCALDRCLSKTKNQDSRRYLESQRIQALQAGRSIKYVFPQDDNCSAAEQYFG